MSDRIAPEHLAKLRAMSSRLRGRTEKRDVNARKRVLVEKVQYYLSPEVQTIAGAKKAVRKEARRRGISTIAMITKLRRWRIR